MSSRSESPLVGEAKASPTPAVPTVWRSGRSSTSHDSRKATSDDPRADQEHGRERVGEGAGVAVADRCGEPLDRARVERAGAGAGGRGARELARSAGAVKIAPSAAVPSEPPMERNSVAPEVATPSSE